MPGLQPDGWRTDLSVLLSDMSELAIKMTSDDQQLAAAVQRLDGGIKLVEASFDRAAVSSHKAATAASQSVQAQNRLVSEGKRIAESLIRQNENLSESWERQRNAINEAHKDGKLSAEQHGRALELLEQKISDLAAEQRAKARAAVEAGEAEKRAALESSAAYQKQQSEIREGVALTQRLDDKHKSLIDRYRELRGAARTAFQAGAISAEQYRTTVSRLGDEFRELDAKQKLAAGPSAFTQVKQMAAGYVSWASAAAGVRVAIRDVRAEMDKGRSSTQTLQESRQNLLQVSEGDYSKLEARADIAAMKYGVSRTEARQVLFSARSEGFEKDYERVLAMNQVIPASAASRVAGQTNQLFGGTFTADQIIGGVFKGAKESRLDFAPIAEQLPVAAEGASLASASAPETIAALSVLASKFNNAGDRIKAIASKMGISDATRGKGLIGGIKTLQAMSEADRKEFLGDDQEKNAAYQRFVEMMPQIEKLTGEIDAEMKRAGTPESLVNKRLAEKQNDKTAQAFLTAEKLKIMNEITAENRFSETESNLQGLRAVNKIRGETGQQNGASTFVQDRFIDAASIGPGGLKGDASEKLEKELAKQTEILTAILNKNAGGSSPQIPITRPGEDK